mgnify:CR=1 FL=1
MTIVNEFVDIAFLSDILVVFRTSYYDSKIGEEILSSKLIAKRYLRK